VGGGKGRGGEWRGRIRNTICYLKDGIHATQDLKFYHTCIFEGHAIIPCDVALAPALALALALVLALTLALALTFETSPSRPRPLALVF